MRVVFFLLFCLSVSCFAFSQDFDLRVVDPQSAAVAGAKVSLIREDGKVAATQFTDAEGFVRFHIADLTGLRVEVLAPGFAPGSQPAARNNMRVSDLAIQLQVATAAETVVVSATRTPVVGEAAGADVDSLSGAQLTTMQPIAADDTLRFLPGAVVNTAGQRGGLSSLFVRGGESNYNKVIVDGVTVNEPGGTFDFGTLSLEQGDRMEFVRGAQSTLYGSDAMTSVVQSAGTSAFCSRSMDFA